MENDFSYFFEFGDIDSFPNDKEEFEQKGRDYFKKLSEQNHTIAELHEKEEALCTIKEQLLSLWWEDEDDPTLANNYIKKVIEYVNSFNYFRFINKTPDYLPVGTLRVVLGLQSVADCPNNVDEHQESIQEAARVILDLLLDEDEHNIGIYIYGFEV